MPRSKLPVVDIQKGIVEGDLSLKTKDLQFGEFWIKASKEVMKYNVGADGTLSPNNYKLEDGYDIVSETEYKVVLNRKFKIKLKFLRTPEEVEKGVGIISQLIAYQLSADNGDIALPDKWVIAQDMLPLLENFLRIASIGFNLNEGEQVVASDALDFFSLYININDAILKQSMVFLARKKI